VWLWARWPELLSMNKRQVDIDNMVAQTWHLNQRMAWDDLSRVFWTDRPSRLHKLPRTR
jgi:hypothetical protein